MGSDKSLTVVRPSDLLRDQLNNTAAHRAAGTRRVKLDTGDRITHKETCVSIFTNCRYQNMVAYTQKLYNMESCLYFLAPDAVVQYF